MEPPASPKMHVLIMYTSVLHLKSHFRIVAGPLQTLIHQLTMQHVWPVKNWVPDDPSGNKV